MLFPFSEFFVCRNLTLATSRSCPKGEKFERMTLVHFQRYEYLALKRFGTWYLLPPMSHVTRPSSLPLSFLDEATDSEIDILQSMQRISCN